jgi:hypothetical protein
MELCGLLSRDPHRPLTTVKSEGRRDAAGALLHFFKVLLQAEKRCRRLLSLFPTSFAQLAAAVTE